MDKQRHIMQRALAQSFAGEVIQPSRLYMATRGEVSKIGTAIFESIKKVADSGELPRGEDSINELLQFFDSKFNPIVSEIRTGLGTNFTNMRAGAIPADQFDEHTEDVRRSEKLEIKLLMAKIMRDESNRKNSLMFTFNNSPVAVLQVGDKNLANAGPININAADKEKIKEALRTLSERIANIEELNSVQKTELREVVTETEAELSKETSNWMRVRGLLSVAVAAIEKIAALKEVYDLLLPLLPAVGIHHVG
jgi:hypothetical protein